LVLHALGIDTILAGLPIREMNPMLAFGAAASGAGVIAALILCSSRAFRPSLLGVAGVVAYAAIACVLFREMHLMVPLAGPIALITVTMILALIGRAFGAKFPERRQAAAGWPS
jgi:hypothetical protein